MKKLFLNLFLAAVAFNAFGQQLTLSDATPEAGKVLSFKYDPAGGKLARLANVQCKVYTFINLKQKVVDITLTKEGDIYRGSFTPADSTAIAVFTFSADGTKDENPKGYYTLFYRNGQPTDMAYYWEAQFYNGMGKAFAGVDVDKKRAVALLEKGFALYPKMKEAYGAVYLNLQYGIDKVMGERLIKEEISKYNAAGQKSEENWLKIANLYGIMKNRVAADSVKALVMKNFPQGNYAFNETLSKIYDENDAVKKEKILEALVRDFNLNPVKDANRLENLYANQARAYGALGNKAKFQEYASKVKNKVTLAGIYNTYAWAEAEKKGDVAFATQISKQSLDLLAAAKNDPLPSYYTSKEDYIKGLESSYASYADTYALLLSFAGNYAEAQKYQEEAVTKNNFSNPDMNTRYVTFLVKAGQAEKARTYAERFVKDGQGSDEMRADLKALYKGQAPFDSYYAGLEKVAVEKEKAKMLKEMIDMPAPKFTLKNLNGETVSLEKLKGKVVIVDYWATWCGPCIASFPGMQKAVDKYKNDPNVAFLFVNTWQTEENREKVVKDFMAGTSYTFNVLLDTKNVKNPSKFDVIEQYKVEGIPTKFIIDGNGAIRFKKVGFNGSADATVRELDTMIALAKEGK